MKYNIVLLFIYHKMYECIDETVNDNEFQQQIHSIGALQTCVIG